MNQGKLQGVHNKQFQDGITTRIDMDRHTITIQSREGVYQMFYFDGVDGGVGDWAVLNTPVVVESSSASANTPPASIVDRSTYTNAAKWAMNTTLPNYAIYNTWYGGGYTCLAGAGQPYTYIGQGGTARPFWLTYPKMLRGSSDPVLQGPVGAVACAYKNGWFVSLDGAGKLTWWQGGGGAYYDTPPAVTTTPDGNTILANWRINKDCTKAVGVTEAYTTADYSDAGGLFQYEVRSCVVEISINEDTTAQPQNRFSLSVIQRTIPRFEYGCPIAADYQIMPDLTERLVVLSVTSVDKYTHTVGGPHGGFTNTLVGSYTYFELRNWSSTNPVQALIHRRQILGNPYGTERRLTRLPAMDLRKGIFVLIYDYYYTQNELGRPATIGRQYDVFKIGETSVSSIYKSPTPEKMQWLAADVPAEYASVDSPNVDAGLYDNQNSPFLSYTNVAINTKPPGDVFVYHRLYALLSPAGNPLSDAMFAGECTLSSIPSVGRNCIAVYYSGTVLYDGGVGFMPNAGDFLITTSGAVPQYHQKIVEKAGINTGVVATGRFDTTYGTTSYNPTGYAASSVFLWPYEAWRD